MIFPDAVIKMLQPHLDRKVFYRDYYLNSSHWKAFRAKAKKHYGNKCATCFRFGLPGVIIDCHHKNYDNLWHEKIEDVELACRECHDKKHDK